MGRRRVGIGTGVGALGLVFGLGLGFGALALAACTALLDIRDFQLAPTDGAADVIVTGDGADESGASGSEAEAGTTDADASLHADADATDVDPALRCAGREAGASGTPPDASVPDANAVTVLASTQLGEIGIHVHQQRLLWTSCGSVWMRPLDGGAAVTIAKFQFGVWDVTASGNTAYIARNFQYDPTVGSNVKKAALIENGVVESFGFKDAHVTSIDVASGVVYWTADGGVYSCAVGGCNNAPTLEASLTDPASGLVADGEILAWTIPTTGTVERCQRTSCAATREAIATGQSRPFQITTDGTNLYWTNEGTSDGAGSVMRSDRDGCNPVALATNMNTPAGIATDGIHVYWAIRGASPDYLDGFVVRCFAGGCNNTPTVIASAQAEPIGVALDDARVYWTTHGLRGVNCGGQEQGAVLSAPK